ncbi:unnamed protein product [Anisakis simplex]|uniref:Storkhead-box protein 1 n=1 Tax=Anisakis simplex TaxID=6269 RepID=A0A0M3JUL9_ANISI|nr:unnamed protein product [Anisakis simplex]
MSRAISTQCIGIIFQSLTSKRKSGHRIFESFIEENRSCFWNIALVDAVNSIEYIGFMRPGTLFVSSVSERHLITLRSAWARRILKPAKGFTILSLGMYITSFIK